MPNTSSDYMAPICLESSATQGLPCGSAVTQAPLLVAAGRPLVSDSSSHLLSGVLLMSDSLNAVLQLYPLLLLETQHLIPAL
jgi:hypothetical protein